jgi:hypothetical protein
MVIMMMKMPRKRKASLKVQKPRKRNPRPAKN